MARAFLKIVAGSRAGLNVPLSTTEPLVIGRREGDLLLEDQLISGRHCQVIFRLGEYVLQDLGSTNGSLVDGRLVREALLRPGAEVALGSTRLVLFLADDPPEPPAAPAEVPAAGPGAAGPPKELEIAWLLNEEQVEVGGRRSPVDIVGQDLRVPPGMNAVLEVVAGADLGRIYRFTRGNMTIGRRAGEVPLSDTEVSRRHAVIELFGREMVFLRDTESTNGTWHNGRRVYVARLRIGDTVGVGKTVLRLSLGR